MLQNIVQPDWSQMAIQWAAQ